MKLHAVYRKCFFLPTKIRNLIETSKFFVYFFFFSRRKKIFDGLAKVFHKYSLNLQILFVPLQQKNSEGTFSYW